MGKFIDKQNTDRHAFPKTDGDRMMYAIPKREAQPNHMVMPTESCTKESTVSLKVITFNVESVREAEKQKV